MNKIKQSKYGKIDACPPEGLNALRPYIIHTNLDHLMGEVLTIIDASIVDATQNRSVKDLIKDKFSKKHAWISELAFMDVEHSDTERMGDASYSIVRLTPEQLKRG